MNNPESPTDGHAPIDDHLPQTNPSPIHYTVGQNSDPLAESLARALHNANTGGHADEAPLPDDHHPFEQDDPFFCGEYNSHRDVAFADYMLENDDLTSEELLKQWFGPSSKSDWFPYANKAVSQCTSHLSAPLT